jgi:hypothetical protein
MPMALLEPYTHDTDSQYEPTYMYIYAQRSAKVKKKNVKVVERDRRWSEPYTPPQLLDVNYKVVYERPMTLGQ